MSFQQFLKSVEANLARRPQAVRSALNKQSF